MIEAEGSETDFDRFFRALKTELPPLARIDRLTLSDQAPRGDARFRHRSTASAQIGPLRICAARHRHLRRHARPISLRPTTGASDIPSPTAPIAGRATPSSATCLTTGRTPPWRSSRCARVARRNMTTRSNRRFHAEPNACPECGPSLALLSAERARLERARRICFRP